MNNSVAVPGQELPPIGINTIQLYRGQVGNAPVITLHSNQQLTLKFDELGFETRMLRVRFTHHNADWTRSSLLPNFYLRGFQEDYITKTEPSHIQRPAYTHYTYRFPNNNVEFLASGNYMVEVYDYERDEILFSLPFFVHENEGHVETNIEEFFGPARPFLSHQIFSTYTHPDYVTMPGVDLETHFVQNHFWGRARTSDITDISARDHTRMHITRDNAYVGRFEFRRLDLRRFRQQGINILEVREETIPPQLILRRDVVNLDVNPGISQSHLFGNPVDTLSARYADVYFELELPNPELTELPVYIIGPFNNWSINENNRMVYNQETDSYTGNALIKEGFYNYKYAVVEDGTVNDIRLDASFTDTRQIYHTFVYFYDPQQQADRLLNVQAYETR